MKSLASLLSSFDSLLLFLQLVDELFLLAVGLLYLIKELPLLLSHEDLSEFFLLFFELLLNLEVLGLLS